MLSRNNQMQECVCVSMCVYEKERERECVCVLEASVLCPGNQPAASEPPSKALPQVHSAIRLGRHKALSHVGFNVTLQSCELKQ